MLKWIYEMTSLFPRRSAIVTATRRGHEQVLEWLREKNGSIPINKAKVHVCKDPHVDVIKSSK